MHTGLLELTLSLEGCFSLKEKRALVQPLRRKIENQFSLSVASRGLERHSQEILVFALLAVDKDFIEKIFSQIIALIELGGEVEVIDIKKEIFYWQG